MYRTAGVGLFLVATALSATADDLTQLSLEQLGDVKVTSVSKSPEMLRGAPAAIYVITHEDIERSGVTTLVEALRLAPNARIRQLGASNYVAAARGFGGNEDVQNFSNKLLLLIDGRSVYTPLFSGIYLDTQDVLLADIDRIEVISGPGATLWGANAVNGVINFITRPSYTTEGTLASATLGSREQTLNMRYGHKLREDLAFRVYGKGLQIWGAGLRLHDYRITNSTTLLFDPADRTLKQLNVFAQDTMALRGDLSLTLGIKLERNDYSGWEPQPDLRLAWLVNDSTLLWGAISRAVRSPTPLDADVIERVGGIDFLRGNPDFQSEKVLAYEVGYRGELSARVSLSVSGYYNLYNDLRTVEPASSTIFLPLSWDNFMKGHTYGVVSWAKWQVTDWWRLSPGVAWLHRDLQFKRGASRLLGVAQAGNDPRGHALLNSSMQFGSRRTLDLTLRHVASLPDPALPAYTELSARLGWPLSAEWELAVTGTNLLHAGHQEYPAPTGATLLRSVAAEVRWKK